MAHPPWFVIYVMDRMTRS